MTDAYASFRTRLAAGFALLVLLLTALLAWGIVSGYRSQRAAAVSQTRSFAQAMSAHIASEMQVVDLSLLRSADALGRLDRATLRDRARVRQILALSASVSDANFWMHLVDADGFGVVASNNLAINGISYADRPYFTAHAGRCDDSLFIGAPELGRVSKRKLFFLSRSVCTPGGVPLGVVVAPVDARALATVFDSALFQPNLSIVLLHGDGRVIARAPLFDRSFAQDLTRSELYRHWRVAPRGSYEGRSMVDGQVRVFSYQTVAALPLAIAVGIATDSWAQAIGKDLSVIAGAFGLIALVLLFSGRFALRAFRRVEQSDRDQRELNSQLVATQDQLEHAAKRARMIADSLPALVAYIDADERYVFHNSYYGNIPGIDPARITGRTMREVLGNALYAAISDQVHAVLSGTPVNFERTMQIDALVRHLKFDYSPDIDDTGAVLGFYTMVLDITEAKEVEARLSKLARVDGLTGLPNRNQLYERLDEALARARRGGQPIGCLYLDIDHFKSINDTLGHAGGDEVLRQFGRRLRACVRETDLVARLAGDEFVIVLEGLGQPAASRTVAAKIIAAMHLPFLVEGATLAVSTSVGVAISDAIDEDVDSLLKKADTELYQAKRDGRGGFRA